MREYRCTRNALYAHDCTGRDDLRERQGHYIWAINEEAAWQEMTRRYPEETEAGFTVKEWQGFNVIVVEFSKRSPEMNESLNAAQSELQVMNFFAAALQDKVLLDRLMEAMGAKDNVAIITMAVECGYNFSQESLRQGLTKVFHLMTPIMQEQNLAVSEEID